MTDQKPEILQIKLNPAGVAEPAQRAVIEAARAVGTFLRSLALDDLAPIEPGQGVEWGYRFDGLDYTLDEWRETLERWVLAKGFQDLARGIRETLEEAHFYLAMIRFPNGQRATLREVQETIAQARAQAARPKFPDLMAQVNEGLTSPLNFSTHFVTLQNVRNCLEHRGGIVGQRDADPSTRELVLTFPRLSMFYMRGDEEVELRVGEVIDNHAPDAPFPPGEQVQILQRITDRRRVYQLGERVVITSTDFHEAAMACHFFATDLVTKLPGLPTIAEEGGS